jgi:hypothetical protein
MRAGEPQSQNIGEATGKHFESIGSSSIDLNFFWV